MRSIQSLVAFATVLLIGSVVAADITLSKAGVDLKNEPDMTIGALKAIVATKLGVPAKEIELSSGGKKLPDSSKIVDHNLTQDSVIDYKFKGSEQPKSDRRYFGVDADDAEAVKRKQRELSEDKFREMFGEDVKFEMDYKDPESEKPDPSRGPGFGIKDVLNWMYYKVKNHVSHHLSGEHPGPGPKPTTPSTTTDKSA